MQEVFEKIIDKLEERTSFLSDCTKYGNKDAEQQNKSYSTMMMYEVSDLVDDLIEIVKQEAEKCKTGHFGCNSNGQHEKCSACCDYDCKNRNREWFGEEGDNNDWIPCSERLPEDKQTCLVTARIYFTPDHVDEIDNYIGVGIDTYSKQFGWLDTETIAWQPLPAPYRSNGERPKKTNFDRCCESVEAMAQVIDIAKIGWTKEQIMDWLQKEECEVPE